MSALYDAVLFDRDGTLIADVPYNGDPGRVVPMPGARAALDRLRGAGLRVGVVTNQSGLARGRFTAAQLAAVNARVEELLGPFGTWQVCPHDESDDCGCRKPAPGLVRAAADALGTVPARCAVVGDIGRDLVAAGAAGAAGILVPTPVTLPAEVAAAPAVAADLAAAADLILRRQALVTPAPAGPRGGTVLVVRADSAGDVLLTGPAIRAVAAGADRVVLLCGPRGRAAADLLPGVDEIIQARLPWIDPRPGPVEPDFAGRLAARLAAAGADQAVIFTSYHQSALPLALLLRAARIGRITAISDDYPGSLLDVRHRVPDGLPEAERSRSVAAAAGFALPAGDDGALRIRTQADVSGMSDRMGGYVVVHPGASVKARACPPETMHAIVAALRAAGHRVIVTAGPGERTLAAAVAGHPAPPGPQPPPGLRPPAGPQAPPAPAGPVAALPPDGPAEVAEPGSLAELAGILAGAGCVVVGNTGPAHLAAAVGTPVVSLYAPTVPFGQWAPYRVPHLRLGDPLAPCRDSRATRCPQPGHPCLRDIDPAEVVAAVRLLRPHAAVIEEVAA